jgi:hypothetical protein
LIPTEVKGALRNVSYPPGKSRTFAFSDEPLLVYDGELAIEGEWSSPPTPLTLVYQPCDETRCLPPVTRVLATDNR